MWNPTIGVPLAIAGLIVLALIWLFGRPDRAQGERRGGGRNVPRVEPSLAGEPAVEGEGDVPIVMDAPRAGAGARPDRPIDRIITLHVAAAPEAVFEGPQIVIAAEKTGLEFGDRSIFHRLVAGALDEGPVFSMASMVQPGSFDLADLAGIRTPGLSLFMTLPGPLPALDAWEMLLPTAQRLAELLEGQVLDEDRSALSRQRIAHIRDELRSWDREQERSRIRPDW